MWSSLTFLTQCCLWAGWGMEKRKGELFSLQTEGESTWLRKHPLTENCCKRHGGRAHVRLCSPSPHSVADTEAEWALVVWFCVERVRGEGLTHVTNVSKESVMIEFFKGERSEASWFLISEQGKRPDSASR